MELVKYLRVLRRWILLIALGPVLAASAAGVTSLLLPKVYEAKVSILVRPAQPLSSDPGVASLTSDQISRTYARLMTEPPLLDTVISDLNLHTNRDQLAKEISVTPQTNTTILDVTVSNTDPALARDIANTLVDDFIQEIKQIEAQENTNPTAQSHDNLVVVSPATKPTSPAFPNLPLNLAIGFAAGLVLAIGLAFLFEYLDQSIKADEDLLHVGVVPLGRVPFVAAPQKRRGELVTLDTDSPASEAYRTLRTNVLFSAVDGGNKSIVVTSALPGEGKSRTAANLAVTLAQAGYKTLLIDCDFRRPSQHKLFGKVANYGLSNLILKDRAETDLVNEIEGVPGLWLLASGPTPPNPSELLGSGRMRELLSRFYAAFTFVVLDTPPVNLVTDASIVAAGADMVMLVVEQGRTARGGVKHAHQALERVGAKVAGAVLNKVRPRAADYYMYGYGYGYEYNYGRNGNGKHPAPAASKREETATPTGG